MTVLAASASAAAPPPVGPGLLGFLVVAAIGVALYLLVKSMNRRLSKIEVPYEDELRKREAAGTEAERKADGTR